METHNILETLSAHADVLDPVCHVGLRVARDVQVARHEGRAVDTETTRLVSPTLLRLCRNEIITLGS